MKDDSNWSLLLSEASIYFTTFIGEYFRHQPVSSTETKTQKQEHKSKMTKLSLSFKQSYLVHEVSQKPVQAGPTTPELPSD